MTAESVAHPPTTDMLNRYLSLARARRAEAEERARREAEQRRRQLVAEKAICRERANDCIPAALIEDGWRVVDRSTPDQQVVEFMLTLYGFEDLDLGFETRSYADHTDPRQRYLQVRFVTGFENLCADSDPELWRLTLADELLVAFEAREKKRQYEIDLAKWQAEHPDE